MWMAVVLENDERHVVPLGDLRDHAYTNKCWCHPFDDDGITVHNSMDKRELVERGGACKH